jgi:D-serine deaminase-like pyridoxal phosphate-dependent protein
MRHSIPQDDGPKRRWPRIVGRASFRIKAIGMTMRRLQTSPRLQLTTAPPLPFVPALLVLATVVSANSDGQITGDVGTKALAVNGPPPALLIGVPDGATYAFAGDEHGTITLPADTPRPAVGSRMLIGATHCDPTVNLHAEYHAVDGDGGVTIWPIIGRYGATPSPSPEGG